MGIGCFGNNYSITVCSGSQASNKVTKRLPTAQIRITFFWMSALARDSTGTMCRGESSTSPTSIAEAVAVTLLVASMSYREGCGGSAEGHIG